MRRTCGRWKIHTSSRKCESSGSQISQIDSKLRVKDGHTSFPDAALLTYVAALPVTVKVASLARMLVENADPEVCLQSEQWHRTYLTMSLVV